MTNKETFSCFWQLHLNFNDYFQLFINKANYKHWWNILYQYYNIIYYSTGDMYYI